MPPTLGHGKICYLQIPALDIAQSADFYAKTFGWTIRRRGDGATAFDDGVNEVSGSWELKVPPSASPGIMIYIMVDDAAATLERIVANGGAVVQGIGADPGEITARFRDPGGNILAIYQHPEK